MKNYPDQAKSLRKSGIINLDIHKDGGTYAIDRITGKIELKEPELICLQIPPAKGWGGFVDGTRQEIFKEDSMFSAIAIPSGTHKIEFRYRMPGLMLEIAVSLVTALVLVIRKMFR